ncbi:MAG TPA: S1 RNA-binding domain-containing protein [Isosphaeraceae bacterium]|jgi:small subunit ribosomal protein S1|nr:S1 RNA-binding domain-containing protein [Isosphaeraceae bacterium]
MSEPSPRDEAIDEMLERATARPTDRPKPEVSLKRQWDEGLEAELEAALEGFDPVAFDVETRGRTRAADREHVPQPGRGQEERPGDQKGKVIAVRGKSVFVDLGAKSEGVVPVEQFGAALPNPGDMIDVVFDRFDAEEGLLILSLKGAAVEATWENLRKGLVVEARVTRSVKGGLEVDVDGIRGFLPISQIDLNRVEETSAYINQRLRVVVTEANRREKNLVVSRRELQERERAEQREKTWKELDEGQVRKGVIRSVKDFGAFVDIGGVDGLLHVADMSWARAGDAGSLVKVGQEVEVKVLKIDREKQKVNLGLKQLLPDPWDEVEDRFPRGATIQGKVTKLMDFGAFVELAPGIEGLIHISELGPKRVFRVKDAVQPGQEVEVRILKVEPDVKRISLTLRPQPTAPAPEPEDEEPDTPPAPKPVRKVPLKGGLGDRDPDPSSGR